MADFIQAFERMIRNEGGYSLHEVPGDRGGQTYAGIARRRWPGWEGWEAIDSGQMPSPDLVQAFYREHFWDAIRGDEIEDQRVAGTIFDFAVNAGTRTAVRLAQSVAGTTPDGIVGPKTLQAINAMDPAVFLPRYALAKIERYAAIASRDSSQRKFLLGWINRALRESGA